MQLSRRTEWGVMLTACIAVLAASPAFALDKVSLQLKWKHQFQFAGYYAALEKGFYRDAGFETWKFARAGRTWMPPRRQPPAKPISGFARPAFCSTGRTAETLSCSA